MLVRDNEKLKELIPFSMPCIQLVLPISVGQNLVIQMEYKRLGFEVMIPMLQSPTNGIEILVISGVVGC